MTDRYAGMMENDVVNGEGVCVSFWTQGCPHHCPDCHNPETWDYNGGKVLPADFKNQIIKAISANGIQRNFSILGGEPLCPENIELVEEIVNTVRVVYPNIKIYLWTGYDYYELINDSNVIVSSVLEKIDVLIDGKYEKEKRDLTLKLRGSSNQHIYRKQEDGSFISCEN